ncbi:hypothetical protein PVK06_011254 [Gossypium arboreum]|uniref:Uncharacterized protein n=1 Tax=Gossypium arboreum TaxID=29729 RepID=A0ABR0Q941_GOSAR|nr:hypothetical protein PVK06_011254 [Gossypium arboreum]
MTRAQTKQFQDALSALVMRILEENKALDIGEAMDTLLKTQCTLLQADFSSSPAPQLNSAPTSSLELVSARMSSILARFNSFLFF